MEEKLTDLSMLKVNSSLSTEGKGYGPTPFMPLLAPHYPLLYNAAQSQQVSAIVCILNQVTLRTQIRS